ncbi:MULTISPECIES: FAD/NAD(P)-binding domain-containing protein [unclassified Bacillus cereus group]|uniref:FAD/NAD(P)-binding protein n=1 Tax=unclassified Bacillus cereus group TaxID=2750818 RepID=UPI001F577D5A|nr:MULTISPECIES: FAD/NAD(P)-binding protein [unclassified Bacillus cereus group]
MFNSEYNIGIIGMGPRGLSILERLCANLIDYKINKHIKIYIIDPYPPGAGKVWRTNQSPHLLMNTVASQISLYTDSSVECAGPKISGPSLYEWAKFITLMGIDSDYSEQIKEEANALQPDSYPTRAFYGYYLEWVYNRIISNLPENASVYVHQTNATSLYEDENGKQIINLENQNIPLIVDSVILSLGHYSTILSKTEHSLKQFADNCSLTYIPPNNPADVNLNNIKPKENVILRGMGLNFFDYMSLLTLGRGGSFIRENGKLIYQPSGQEPRMYAGSRRGIPYHARGENEKGAFGRHEPIYLTSDIIKSFQKKINLGEKINFKTKVWPLIAKEVETVYYMTLIQSTSCKCKAALFRNEYMVTAWNSKEEQAILDKFDIPLDKRWDWEEISYPYKNLYQLSHHQYREWLLTYLKKDMLDAYQGNVSGPIKSALDVLRDLRNEIRLIIDYGKLSGESYKSDLQKWYTPLNAFLSIGPPVQRIEQMIALIEAGILEILGPDIEIELHTESARFHAKSNKICDSKIDASVLIEARLPNINLKQATNPLLADLLNTSQITNYTIMNADGTQFETGGIAVTPPPNRLIDKNGTPYLNRFAYGVPTEGVHWVTAAGIRPGVNSVTLIESDAIARAVLSLGVTSTNLVPISLKSETLNT